MLLTDVDFLFRILDFKSFIIVFKLLDLPLKVPDFILKVVLNLSSFFNISLFGVNFLLQGHFTCV